jgi:pilus assembly protein FimV
MPLNTRSGTTALKTVVSALAFALISSVSAHAVGLGKLTVMSALGQPLKAELDLTALANDDTGSVAIKLASVEAFRQANIEFNPALLSLRFSIERRSNRQVIAITSAQPINEPFVDLLLELNWSSGRLLREYTFLLDPPEIRTNQAAQSIQTAQMAEALVVSELRGQASADNDDVLSRARAAMMASRATKSAAATLAAPAAATQYQVRSGDTLSDIALRVKPVSVSLDQMLAALYRSNESAFTSNNMNRLQAGKILALPDPAAINVPAESDARALVIAHAVDFAAYRNNLASQVAANAATKVPQTSQSAAGKIAAKVEERATPANASKDQLKLSKAGDTGAAVGGKSALTEDQIVKDQQTADAAARVNELEKNVRDLETLMAAKKLQEQTNSAPAAVPKPALAASQMPAPAPAPAPELAAANKEAPASSMLDWVFGNMLYVWGVLLALLLLALLAFRRYKQSAKVAESTPADNGAADAGAQGADANNSIFNSTFSASPSQIDMDEVDPLAEADVYIAYGREAQAEEILKEALRTHPERHPVRLKLLEIYAGRKDVGKFAVQASELHDLTAGNGNEWAQAAALGLTIDPLNLLYASAAEVIEAAPAVPFVSAANAEAIEVADSSETNAAIDQDRVPAGSDLSDIVGLAYPVAAEPGAMAPVELDAPVLLDADIIVQSKPIETAPMQLAPDKAASSEEAASAFVPAPVGLPALDIDFDLLEPVTAASVQVAPPAPAASDDNSLDFDFDFDLPPAVSGKRAASADLAKSDTDTDADVDNVAEPLLELDLSDVADDVPIYAAAPVTDLSGMTLDIDQGEPVPTAPVSVAADADVYADAEAVAALEVEMDTKLELAIAYQEIGDKEGARELIDEVIHGGNKAQNARALSMKAKLG